MYSVCFNYNNTTVSFFHTTIFIFIDERKLHDTASNYNSTPNYDSTPNYNSTPNYDCFSSHHHVFW